MDDRVFLTGPSPEIPEDALHIRPIQQVCQIIDDPDNAAVQFRPGDMIEHPPQERVRFRQIEGGVLADEVIACRQAGTYKCLARFCSYISESARLISSSREQGCSGSQ